jgi:uncharacterized protein (DUF2252 family)
MAEKQAARTAASITAAIDSPTVAEHLAAEPPRIGETGPLSLKERRALGHRLRERVPRRSHAVWAEPPNRADPVALLESQAATRLSELVPIRYARMQVSPFAFLRGSAIVMAHDLAHTPISGIQTQLCGDAHLANFGVYASPERTLVFDINDFDETLPGPWEWDVKRLATSCYVAGRNNGFPEGACRAAALSAASSYRLHMARFAEMGTLAVWYAHVTADELVNMIANKRTLKRTRKELAKIRHNDSLQAIKKLTEVVEGRRLIAHAPPLITRVPAEQQAEQVHEVFAAYARTMRGAQQVLFERYQLVDVAYKVVGVGSVGTRCFILLLMGRDEDDPLFLQVKQAEASILEACLPKSEFTQQGERVVAGQVLMQAASDIFLGWVRGPQGWDFYVRQLRDMKGSAAIELLSRSELALWASFCGWALARAHARAGDPARIAAYLGSSSAFEQAIALFAEAYANQTERDYLAFRAAIQSGRITAALAG